jgi:hypothetical protein
MDSKFSGFLDKTGNFVNTHKKPLLYVGGAVAIVIVGIAVVNRLKKAVAGQNVIGGTYHNQDVDLTKTSISQATAQNYAEQLFKAFNYYWGTDLSAIKTIFKKINAEDFKMIYNAFGERTYSSINGGTPSGSIIGLDNPTVFGKNPDIDLMGWLNNELGVLDFTTKSIVRPVVEKAGFILS